MAEELYFKLKIMNNESIRLCVNDNVFNVFHKSVYDGVKVIITTYEMVQRLDYFLVINEAHLLLQHASLIEVT